MTFRFQEQETAPMQQLFNHQGRGGDPGGAGSRRRSPHPQVSPSTCSPCCSTGRRRPSSRPDQTPAAPLSNRSGRRERALRRAAHAGEGGDTSGAARELVAVLRASDKEARELRREYVSTEHLLLVLRRVQDARGRRLSRCRANHDALQQARRGAGRTAVTDQNPEDSTSL